MGVINNFPVVDSSLQEYIPRNRIATIIHPAGDYKCVVEALNVDDPRVDHALEFVKINELQIGKITVAEARVQMFLSNEHPTHFTHALGVMSSLFTLVPDLTEESASLFEWKGPLGNIALYPRKPGAFILEFNNNYVRQKSEI